MHAAHNSNSCPHAVRVETEVQIVQGGREGIGYHTSRYSAAARAARTARTARYSAAARTARNYV